MAVKHAGGLGRGLGELFQRTDEAPTDAQAAAPASATMPDGSWFQELPVDSIQSNPRQPRQVFDEDSLAELASSVTEVGLLQPVVVRPLGGDRYELVMGERRLRAHQIAGLERIPAIIRATEDADLLRDALLENLHRTQLNPLEEAAAYQQLMDDFGCSQEELAHRVKRSRPHISNTIRLLKLPPAVQRRVAAGVLSAGHARALLMVEDGSAQERLAQRIVAEGLSVRATEELVTIGNLPTDRPARGSATRAVNPRATSVATVLCDRFDTRVKVAMNAKGRGRIAIDFASEEDLERILDLLGARD